MKKNNSGKSLGGNNLAENLRNLYVHSINKRPISEDILKIFESCSAPGHYNFVYQDVLNLIREEDMNSLIKLEAQENIDPKRKDLNQKKWFQENLLKIQSNGRY